MRTRVLLILTFMILLISITGGCEQGTQDTRIRKSSKGARKENRLRNNGLEIWQKESMVVLKNVVSPSSILLPDGTVRCYFSEGGYINYVESKDGKDFGEKVRTNIGVSDPAKREDYPVNVTILRLKSGRFMMLYSTGFGGEKFQGHSQSTKLHLAYSDDGADFQDRGVVGDLEKDLAAVVDVADAVLLLDGRIRLFGRENGISTAVSKDGGRTWITDGFQLIEGGDDPDVHVRPDGTFVMYYSAAASTKDTGKDKGEIAPVALEKGYIKMALSKDGLEWKPVRGRMISPDKGNNVVFAPDYLRLNKEAEIVYFNEAKTAKYRAEGKATLRTAVRRGD